MSKLIRTFIAVKIPRPQLLEIQNIQNAAKKNGGDIKWVNPDNMHLTLKFLGDVDPVQIKKIAEAVRNAVQSESAFHVSIKGFDGFPNLVKPRVLWLGIEKGKDVLVRIAGHIDENLSKQGFSPEKRPFSPHLTLGRVKSLKNVKDAVDCLKSTPIDMNGFYVTEISVIKSELNPSGSIYTVLDNILI